MRECKKRREKLRVTRGWRDEGNNNSNKKGGVTRGREQIGVIQTNDKWMRSDQKRRR